DYWVHVMEKYGGALRLYELSSVSTSTIAHQFETIHVSDPRTLYHIIVKDQHIFQEPDLFTVSNKLIFGEGLTSTVREQHHRQCKLLNPIFSTSNMRQLLRILYPISNRLTFTLTAQLPVDGSHKEIDVLPWLSRCVLDSVCQGILGCPSSSLSKTEDDAYSEALWLMGPLIGKLMVAWLIVVPIMPYCFPSWFMRDVWELHHIVETVDSVNRTVFAEKKAAVEVDMLNSVNDVYGDGDSIPSMMDIMREFHRQVRHPCSSKHSKGNCALSNTEQLTDAKLLGQMSVMAFAGLDTTTSTLARCVYLLAQHPRSQARLRNEIHDAVNSSIHQNITSAELPYDVLMNLPFLDSIVKETLRLYLSCPFMSQKATKASTLPLQFPARSQSGAYTSSVAVPQGSLIIISILTANRHREMWGANANEWHPEWWHSSAPPSQAQDINASFSGEGAAPTSRQSVPGIKDGVWFPGIYSNMRFLITFLGGSRSCIGFKFAEMEIKQVLVTLILHLHVALLMEPNTTGYMKEIVWKLRVFHMPVVRPPAGDGMTLQVPLNVWSVREEDFKW
ncbi:cytochrome P450, partial [Suillus subluteus]